MPIKEIRYNSDNNNVIIEGKELNIKASDYIEIIESAQKKYILQLLLELDYVFYGHIQGFIQHKFGAAISSINNYLRELEDQGMINAYNINLSKYAMLSKKGIVLITGNPSAVPKRSPQINNLRIQSYMSELLINYAKAEVLDLKEPNIYLNFYKEYYMRISKCNGFDMYEHSERENYEIIYNCLKADNPVYIKGIKKELTKDMISDSEELEERVVRRYLSNILKTSFFSVKEYIEDQVSFLNDYIKLSEYEKTINTRDELGRMIYKNVYLANYQKEKGILALVLLDLHKPNDSIVKVIYELDRCIGKMNQFLDQTYLKFDLFIATSCNLRKLQVESFIDRSLKRIEIENTRLFQKCKIENDQIDTYLLFVNKYEFKKAAPYLNSIKVLNMNIEQYFEPNKCKEKE